jgi:RNA-directed DNA polymerase
MQEEPTEVADLFGTTQAGKTPLKVQRRRRWAWVEASVWTDRMLAALEYGVKGEVWFSLIDKVHNPKNLWSAWAKTAQNQGSAGVDGITIKRYEKDVEANLERLAAELKEGTYQPKAIRRTYIPKTDGKMRPLGIPTVQDRIVQGAIRHVIEPIFEKQFAQHSYGFRPGRGCKDALRRVDALLKAGYRYVVDADLKSYFDSIPHEKLMQRVREQVADGRVLKLIQAFLKARIMEGLSEWTPSAGAPQGAVLSPLLSNIYLNPLDHLMERKGMEMVRYADDFVILCRNMEEAQAALELVKMWTAEAGLTLHPEKTRIADAVTDGFEFLGYRFDKGQRWPRTKSKKKLRESLKPLLKRTSGVSLRTIIKKINPKLRGWYGYFKHARRRGLHDMDRWVRTRLRAIQDKRHKGKGKGRGNAQVKWPNRFFADLGLFSLEQAHILECQSMKMAH